MGNISEEFCPKKTAYMIYYFTYQPQKPRITMVLFLEGPVPPADIPTEEPDPNKDPSVVVATGSFKFSSCKILHGLIPWAFFLCFPTSP